MLSKHAKVRLQQRAIPLFTIDLLLDIGVFEHRNNGLDLVYFNRRGKHEAINLMKDYGLKQIEHCLNAYLIKSSDGLIVTAGHRTKRINRN